MSKHKGSSPISEVYFAVCSAIDTPYTLGLWLRFRDDHKSFLNATIDPRNYDCAYTFAQDYMAFSLLSKYKGLDTGLDLEHEALRRFIDAERICQQTNERLKQSRNVGYPADLNSLLLGAQRKIACLLGPYSTFKVDESYGWGPGATADIPRRRAFVDTKVNQTPMSVTPSALPILRQAIGADLHWSAVLLGVDVGVIAGPFCFLPDLFLVREECVIDTVPKNSKTHRVIAKENTGNGFLQKGFGSYFRRRLKMVGVDLDDQGLNQTAAAAAYSDRLATLDLKAASDTVALELVYELLPVDWALALDDIRSRKAEMPDGSVVKLHKFSSMGNGFTFELESLIFWALASSVSDHVDRSRVWIYGDDIVTSQECSKTLVELLSYCGFTVNTEKSFTDGCFFESCGKHFFKGIDVTPIFQKDASGSDSELRLLGNRLLRWAARVGRGSLSRVPRSAWLACRRLSSRSSHRFFLPLGAEGDDGWLLPSKLFPTIPIDRNHGFRCVVARSPSRRLPADESALLAWTLRRGVETESPYNGSVTVPPPIDAMSVPLTGTRWVIPSEEFGLNW